MFLQDNTLFFAVDTYVKTYLTEEKRRFLCKKTGIARQPFVYRQTVKYLSTDVARRTLLVMLWASQKGSHSSTPSFEDYKMASVAGGGPVEIDNTYGTESCLGVVEVDIEKISNQQLVVGWYRLFTPETYQPECDSN